MHRFFWKFRTFTADFSVGTLVVVVRFLSSYVGRLTSGQVFQSLYYTFRQALKCFILIGWQDFVGVTAVTYLFMPTHQNWSYLFVTCVPVLTSTSSGCSYYTGPVSIDRARSSWRRLQVQTTNASKCIQCLRPSIPKDESLRKLSSFRKLMIRQSFTGCVLSWINHTEALTCD